jgi:hypothetical protein
MAELPVIDDSNTYATKTEGGDVGEPTDLVSAADLNALKSRVSENRTQANAALAATAGAVADQTASFSLAAADHGTLQLLDSSAGASVITVPHTLWGSVYPSGQFRARIFVTNADEAVTLAGSGGLALTYFGRNVIKTGDLITITVRSATYALVEVQPWGDALLPLDGGAVTDPTRTLGVADATQIIGLDPTSNAVEVTIPHTLFWAGGLGRTFQCTLVALNVTNAITLVGSGGLGLVYYGSSTIAAGDIIRISVESQTVCRVQVVKTGDAAGAHIVSTSNPHGVTAAQVGADPKLAVQTAHTAATLTLTDADHNKHRPLNTASNSIAISIPTTLTFPFVWTARKSSASNSVTITTGDAALITPKVSGTVPVTAVDAYITIFAESSTVAAVFVTVPA